MATQSATFQAGAIHATKFTVGASGHAEQTIGFNTLFAIQADQSVTLCFSNSASTGGAVAATANDWPQALGAITQWDIGTQYDTLSVFNTGAATANVWILPLSRN